MMRSPPLATLRRNLVCFDDAAQAFGATYKNRKLGAVFAGRKPGASATATSFFPAKPLGCYGDGGAIFVDDDDLAARIKSLRVHGEGVDKYDAAGIGLAARLDSIQAAVLLEELELFPEGDRGARCSCRAFTPPALQLLAVVPALAEDFEFGADADAPCRCRLRPWWRCARPAARLPATPRHREHSDLLRQAAAPAGGL